MSLFLSLLLWSPLNLHADRAGSETQVTPEMATACEEALDPRVRLENQLQRLMSPGNRDVRRAAQRLTAIKFDRGLWPTTYAPLHLHEFASLNAEGSVPPGRFGSRLGSPRDTSQFFETPGRTMQARMRRFSAKNLALWTRYYLLVHPTVRFGSEDLLLVTRALFRGLGATHYFDHRTQSAIEAERYRNLDALIDFLRDHWDEGSSGETESFEDLVTRALRATSSRMYRLDKILTEDYAAGLIDDHPAVTLFLASRIEFEGLVDILLSPNPGAEERAAVLLDAIDRTLTKFLLPAGLDQRLSEAFVNPELPLPRKLQLVRAIRRLEDHRVIFAGALGKFVEAVPLAAALDALVGDGTSLRAYGPPVTKAVLAKSTESPQSFRKGLGLVLTEDSVEEEIDDDLRSLLEKHLPRLLRGSTDLDWDRWALRLAWSQTAVGKLALQSSVTALFREKHRDDWAEDFILDFYARNSRLDLTEFLSEIEFQGRAPSLETFKKYLAKASGNEFFRAAVVRAAGANFFRDASAPRTRLGEYLTLAPEIAAERPRQAAFALFGADRRPTPRLLAQVLRHPDTVDREIRVQAVFRFRYGTPPRGLSWMEMIQRMPRALRYEFVKDLLYVNRTSVAALADIITSLDPIDGVREAVMDHLVNSPKMESALTDFDETQIRAMFGRGRLQRFFPQILDARDQDLPLTGPALIVAVRSADGGSLTKEWLAEVVPNFDRRGVDAVFGFRPVTNHSELNSQLSENLMLDDVEASDQIRGLIVQGNYEKRGHSIMQGRTTRGASQVEYEASGINRKIEFALNFGTLHHERPLVQRMFTSLWGLNSQDGLIARMRWRAAAIAQLREDFYDLRVEVHNFPNQDTLARIRAYRAQVGRFNPVGSQIDVLADQVARVLERGRPASESITATLKDLPGGGRIRESLIRKFATLWSDPLEQRLTSLASLRVDWREKRSKLGRDSDTYKDIDTLLGDATLSDFVQGNVAREVESLAIPTTVAEITTFGRVIRGMVDHVVLDDLLTSGQGDRLKSDVEEILAAGELGAPQKIESLVRVIQTAIDQSKQTLEVEFGRFDRVFAGIVPREGRPPEPFADDVLRGSNVLMLSRLAERVQKPIEVFNPGRVTGVLRLKPDLARLGPGDIPLFAKLPPQIDPVAGVLTLAVGGRLSHLQLLSRSLGIPNVKIDAKFQDSIAHLDGHRVTLSAGADGTVTLTEAAGEQPESGAYSPKIILPRPDRTIDRPVLLSRAGRLAAVNFAGPKSLNLARLMNDPDLADSVPNGVILPFGFFNRYVGAARLRPIFRTLRLLDIDNQALVQRIAYSVRQLIETTPIPPEMIAEVRTEIQTLGLHPRQGLFVRSDTNVEDLDTFNGAGLNLSLANVPQEVEALDLAIRRVWASAFTERAIAWRAKALHSKLVVMAEPSVLIQPTVKAESSGVITSRGTDQWIAGRGLLSADRGIAAVVEAETGVEEWTFASGVPRRVSSSLSRHRNVIDPSGGLREIDAATDQDVLSREQAGRLNERAMEIERVLGDRPHGWDIEWAMERDNVRILQARPNF